MPFRKISRDVKLAAIRLYERDILDLDDILDICDFSLRTWWPGVSLKQLRKIAAERDPVKRANFKFKISFYAAHEIGFMDEVSSDRRTCGRRRGRAKRGHRAKKKQVFIRGMRLSGTGLLTVDGMVASTVCEGSMTATKFADFLVESVVQFLSFIVAAHFQIM
ncbi:hypothetical protein DL96DRAFT_1476038 [Flagelloscypha sp. PMI_526]|nr:hypothetical protein DL96DRAFT_1476038 [Flagelloscypha sp. PMI_526]